jgi:HAE1 family hydrophobic/amphiphilic exporter-1
MNFDTEQTELYVQVRYQFSEEMSLERKEEIITRVEQLLEPHRQEMMARSIYSFWSDRWSLTRVYLEEGKANEENINAVRAQLRELLPEIAGVRLQVEETSQSWRRHRGRDRVAFQIVGDDTETLMGLAEEAIERLEGIPGLLDVQTRHAEAQQELHIEPDRDLASRYGVTPNQISQVVGLTYRGQRLQRFRTADGEREMRLTLDEQEFETVDQLQNLSLHTGDGERLPLATVAAFNERPGRESIQRDNRMTSIWVNARYSEGTREDYIPQVEAALAEMDFPYGYEWTFGHGKPGSRSSRGSSW